MILPIPMVRNHWRLGAAISPHYTPFASKINLQRHHIMTIDLVNNKCEKSPSMSFK